MIENGYMFTKGVCMYAVTGSAVLGTSGEVVYLCQELREGGKLIAWTETEIRGKQTSFTETAKESTVQKKAEQKTTEEETVLSDSEMSELEAFLETDSCVRKLEILQHMRSKVTDSILDAMSISMDLENENGSLEEKYYCLERCLKMRIRYEGRR